MALHKRVLEQIRRKRLWEPKMSVCIAVSGGLDSMVLLDVMHRTMRAHQGRIMVCTIDHQLRPESKDECLFVQEESKKRGLSCVIVQMEIAKGGNIYERARLMRQKILTAQNTDVIATGHHQNDQAETLLYRLLRGSGIEGLAGMKMKRDQWCRPLLQEERTAIHAYALKHNLSWVEDPSNTKSLRGTLRTIIPLLDKVHGPCVPTLARSALLLGEDARLLQKLQQGIWEKVADDGGLNAKRFWMQERGMQLRLLRMLCVQHHVAVRVDAFIRFVDERNPVLLPKNVRLGCIGEHIVVEKNN